MTHATEELSPPPRVTRGNGDRKWRSGAGTRGEALRLFTRRRRVPPEDLPIRQSVIIPLSVHPMRRLDHARSFRVETAPSAWNDVGRVGALVHRRILDALGEIASVASVSAHGLRECDCVGTLYTVVDGYRVEYGISVRDRTVTLLAVARAFDSR